MSHVYILSQTSYRAWQDHENEENKDTAVLYVYTTAKAANEAAREWVKEYFEDGSNEVKQDVDGCDTWTCELERDDQSHVIISVTKMPLYGDPEDSAEKDDEESSNDKHREQASRSEETQEPPTKRARQD